VIAGQLSTPAITRASYAAAAVLALVISRRQSNTQAENALAAKSPCSWLAGIFGMQSGAAPGAQASC
jgi:hypothetical protein